MILFFGKMDYNPHIFRIINVVWQAILIYPSINNKIHFDNYYSTSQFSYSYSTRSMSLLKRSSSWRLQVDIVIEKLSEEIKHVQQHLTPVL